MRFIAERLVLKFTNKEILNILGFLQEDPKVNRFTIIKLKKQIEKEE